MANCMLAESPAETLLLRDAQRDLEALSIIPAASAGREPPAIAARLADVLTRSLHLDFAFVRLLNGRSGRGLPASFQSPCGVTNW